MGQLKWYKRDPNAALTGMASLSLEERGAYNTILDLIYAHDGEIDDCHRFIAGCLGCDLRIWRRIRQRLLGLGKLYLHAGKLRNARADREVDDCLRRVHRAALAGLASADKRQADRKIINEMASTSVERPSQLSTPTSTLLKKASFSSLPSQSVAARAREAVDPSNGNQPKKPSEVSRTELDEIAERRRLARSRSEVER